MRGEILHAVVTWEKLPTSISGEVPHMNMKDELLVSFLMFSSIKKYIQFLDPYGRSYVQYTRKVSSYHSAVY